MSAAQQAGAAKVKSFISNIITIFLWSLVVITVVAAVVARLHWAACAVPGHSTIAQLCKDWDIVDERPMEDLLRIECTSNSDGSITLHQAKYINSMINRFFTLGEREKLKKASTPYTTNLAQLAIDALEGSTASEPAYPELVKEYQRMVGSLMYCCTATRPDLAYAVHQHCRALSHPTPELVAELRVTFSYLNQHSSLGLTFEAGRRHELSGYSDSDWAIKKYTSGWVIFWQNAPLV